MNYLVELGILMAKWDLQISMRRIIAKHVVEITVREGDIIISKVQDVNIEEAAKTSIENTNKRFSGM